MESKSLILATSTLLLLATSNVLADQSTTGSSGSNHFDTLVEQAKQSVLNVTEHVRTMVGLPEINSNQTIFTESFANQTRLISNQVKDFVAQVHTAAVDKDGLLAPIIRQLNDTANTLNTPELQKQSKTLLDTFSVSVNSILEQIKNVTNEIGKEAQPTGNLYQLAENATGRLVEITRNFEKQIHESVKHKH